MTLAADEADLTVDFPHGVASGDPTAESVVIWTTIAAGCASVRWEVAEDATFDSIVASGTVEPRTSAHRRRHPLSITVRGLSAGSVFAYRFVTDGAASPVGHARTTPSDVDRPSTLRLGVACCARLPIRPFDAYAELAEQTPDLVAFVGDYVYETAHPRHDPRHECMTADDYDLRYAQYRSQRPLRTLHRTAPCVSIWDDHEIANGSWSSGSPADPMGSQVWQRRRRAATDAFNSWMPQNTASGPTGLDRRVRWGDLVDVVLLDARQAGRQRPRRAGGPAIVPDSDDRRILADEQWEWLEQRVAEAPGWLVLCVSTQVAPLHLARFSNPFDRRRRRKLVNPGQWDGYPLERQKLAEMLDRVEGRVLVCSGDLHGRFFTGFESPAGTAIPEITTPSIASRPFASAVFRRLPIPRRVLRRWLARLNPWIDDMSLDVHGSTVLDITPDEIVITSLDSDVGSTTRRLRRGASSFAPPSS